MPDEALDAEKIRLLDQWAEGLQHDERAEVAAAGRAILMLVHEVERLHVRLWDQHLNRPSVGVDALGLQPAPAQNAVESGPELERSLRSRLRVRWPGSSVDA